MEISQKIYGQDLKTEYSNGCYILHNEKDEIVNVDCRFNDNYAKICPIIDEMADYNFNCQNILDVLEELTLINIENINNEILAFKTYSHSIVAGGLLLIS